VGYAAALIPPPPSSRVEPPKDVPEPQAWVWRQVVATKRVSWLTADSLPILTQRIAGGRQGKYKHTRTDCFRRPCRIYFDGQHRQPQKPLHRRQTNHPSGAVKRKFTIFSPPRSCSVQHGP
jgi:hypothetical protein